MLSKNAKTHSIYNKFVSSLTSLYDASLGGLISGPGKQQFIFIFFKKIYFFKTKIIIISLI